MATQETATAKGKRLACRRVVHGSLDDLHALSEAENGPRHVVDRPHRTFAYLSDRIAVDGPASLRRQHRLAEIYAASQNVRVDYLIDSGRPDWPVSYGYAFLRLLQIVGTESVDLVLVESINRFASDRVMAQRAALALRKAGAELRELASPIEYCGRSLDLAVSEQRRPELVAPGNPMSEFFA